jgi:hypothetical protein
MAIFLSHAKTPYGVNAAAGRTSLAPPLGAGENNTQ